MFRAVCVRRPGRHASARRVPAGAASRPGAAGVRVGGARRGRRDGAGQLGGGEPRAAGGDDRAPGGAAAPATPVRGAGRGGKTALAGDDSRFPRLWRCIGPCFRLVRWFLAECGCLGRAPDAPAVGVGRAACGVWRAACGVRRAACAAGVASTPRTGSHIRSPPPAAHAPRAGGRSALAEPRRRRHRGRPAWNIIGGQVIGGQVIAPRNSRSDRARAAGAGAESHRRSFPEGLSLYRTSLGMDQRACITVRRKKPPGVEVRFSSWPCFAHSLEC